MDREAAESAALKNFLGQLTKLDELLNPRSIAGTPTVYAPRLVAEGAYFIRTLFRQGPVEYCSREVLARQRRSRTRSS